MTQEMTMNDDERVVSHGGMAFSLFFLEKKIEKRRKKRKCIFCCQKKEKGKEKARLCDRDREVAKRAQVNTNT